MISIQYIISALLASNYLSDELNTPNSNLPNMHKKHVSIGKLKVLDIWRGYRILPNHSRSIFKDILQEVIYTESVKKAISKEILIAKNNNFSRQKLIFSFLSYELDKHEILEQAALLAAENQEYDFLKQLELFYKHCDGLNLADKIRTEINHTELFLETVCKAIEDFDSISFVERRLIKEINKYVVTQARYYSHFNPGLH